MNVKRRIVKKWSIVFVLILSITFWFPEVVPSDNNAMQVEAATKVKLNTSKTTLAKGQTYQLSITGTSKKVKWTSDDASIATVTSKGKVKAKGVGTTKIIAKVNGKSYSCKITVKKSGEYDTTIAKQNFTYTAETVWNGVIITMKNTSGFAEYVSGKVVFLDASGNQVGTYSELNPYFESGQTGVMFFSIGEGKTFSSYQFTYSFSKPSAKSGNATKIKLTSDRYPTGVLVTAKNNSKITTGTATRISIIYYKDGKPIYCDHDYVNCKKPGSTGEVVFFNPVDSNLDDVTFDDYKLFVDYSY